MELPLLSPGTHLSPDDGACLMELVSVLAGQRWSDQPSCTDPTLATVARVVNDDVSDTARQHLARTAVDLVGRRGQAATLAPGIVAACVAAVAEHAPAARLNRHHHRAARRLAAHAPAAGWRFMAARLAAWAYRRGPAQHAITAAVLATRTLPQPQRDTTLRAMLDAAIAATPAPAAVGGRAVSPERAEGRQPTGDEDIDQQWRGQLRDSFAEIATQRKDLEVQLGGLTTRPEAPSMSDPHLLDRLPIIETDLGRLPEDIERELFDGFQLQVRYHQPTRRVTLRVTIDGEATQRLTATSQAIMGRVGTPAIPETQIDPGRREPSGVREALPLQVVPPAGHITELRRVDLEMRVSTAGLVS
jgi:hypothetical protein